MLFGIDPMYYLFMLPAMIFAIYATIKTHTTFNKYSKVMASSRITGAQAAQRILDARGIRDVVIERVDGFLSDHYDPAARKLRLSPAVYDSPSLSSIGVACHEAGHALQHADNYSPLSLRSMLVPVAQIGTFAPYIFFILGAVLNSLLMFKIGIIIFSLVVLFTLVTLPVEWNASVRAKRLMVSAGVVSPMEGEDAGRVLNAAFLTYVAAAVQSVLTLIYYLLRSGILGGRRD